MATSHNPKDIANKRSSYTISGSDDISDGDGNGVDDDNVNDMAERNVGCGYLGNNCCGIGNDRGGHKDKNLSEKDGEEEEEKEEEKGKEQQEEEGKK